MAFATGARAEGAFAPFDARARKLFLDHLAMTSNVAASARAAGVAAQTAYRLRRRQPDFAALWQAALAEGFARLEGELLAEALTAVSGKVSDATLKSRAQKHRLGLALLSLHRASVRGGTKPVAALDTARGPRQSVTDKILAMHDRMQAARGED